MTTIAVLDANVLIPNALCDFLLRLAEEELFSAALVTGYESLIGQMGNDPKDRHVLAAAVVAGADSIITCNLRDFLRAACEPHGVVAEPLDTVLLDPWAREPRTLLRVLGEQAASTGRRGTRLTVHQVLDYLASAGARRFAAAARHNVPPPDDVPALP